MGSCISKCTKPKKKKFKGYSFNHVQDKLVISEYPTPTPPKMTKIPSESTTTISSSTASTISSISSSTDRRRHRNTNNCPTSSTSSTISTSSSSSLLTSKDRSFSDEFLWSCAKENPHVIKYNPPLPRTRSNHFPPTPKKRARAISPSPTFARQKSFRKENDHKTGLQNRALIRSPSPSRRFGNGIISPYPKRESFRENLIGRNSRQVSTKIEDRVAVGDSRRDVDDVIMEDIDNPLIALDCFIFL